jgi:hypothetical protein
MQPNLGRERVALGMMSRRPERARSRNPDFGRNRRLFLQSKELLVAAVAAARTPFILSHIAWDLRCSELIWESR